MVKAANKSSAKKAAKKSTSKKAAKKSTSKGPLTKRRAAAPRKAAKKATKATKRVMAYKDDALNDLLALVRPEQVPPPKKAHR